MSGQYHLTDKDAVRLQCVNKLVPSKQRIAFGNSNWTVRILTLLSPFRSREILHNSSEASVEEVDPFTDS